MFALDLFNTKYEKNLKEGAVDDVTLRTIEHLLKPLSLRAAEIKNQLRFGKLSSAEIAKLEKEYEDLVQKRLDIIQGRQPETQQETMGYGSVVGEQEPPQRPPAKGLLKGKDLVTPQQRVAGATPQKPGVAGAVKDVAGGIKRWLKGEPDQGPTYESKKKFGDPEVSNELRKLRSSYPAVKSDLEAVLKRDLDSDKEQDKAIQSLSLVNQELQAELDQLKQTGTAAPAPEPTTTAVAAPSMPSTMAPPVTPATAPTSAKAPATAATPAVDMTPVIPAEPAEKPAEPTAAKQAPVRTKPQRVPKITKKQFPAGEKEKETPDARPSADVIPISSRMKQSGLPYDVPKKTGTYNESIQEQDQESPVINTMVQQLTAPNLEKENAKRFGDAYSRTKGTTLYFGHSAGIPLTFADMDGIIMTMAAFPKDKQPAMWTQLLTDPNYLLGFLKQYVPQKGLIEADVIPLAQQRQAPDQLKAYNLAIQILKAARDTNIPTSRVDQMKQILFKDYGTRIQKHPQGYYYIVFDGKPKRLPDPDEFPLEEKWSQKYKRSINCASPKGFSQRAHCAGRKKNESTESYEQAVRDTGIVDEKLLEAARLVDKFAETVK